MTRRDLPGGVRELAAPRVYASSSPSMSRLPRKRCRALRVGALHLTASGTPIPVHLVAAGVDIDITVIRSWLGHVSLDTTNQYAQANLGFGEQWNRKYG